MLKDDRVDPSVANNYTTRFAALNGHTQIVELLLKDNRVDPSALDNSAIRLAAKNGHTQIVEFLSKDKRIDLSTIKYDKVQQIIFLQEAKNELLTLQKVNEELLVKIISLEGKLKVNEELSVKLNDKNKIVIDTTDEKTMSVGFLKAMEDLRIHKLKKDGGTIKVTNNIFIE